MANKERSVPVVKVRKISLTVSAILVGLSIIFLFTIGFNLGIDFDSGLSLRVQINDSSCTIEQVRNGLVAIDSVQVQTVGAKDAQTYTVKVKVDTDTQSKEVQALVVEDLDAIFGEGNTSILESDYIGAKFSDSLVKTSIYAVLIAMALILLYVWMRFELGYAFSAIIALFHDVMCLLGFILIFKFEISSTTIAAVLTIIGYSLNNTIVIFDRIRESVKTGRVKGLPQMIDTSVGKSLTRTTISSITTLLAVLPLAILSSGDIKLFAIEMIFGIAIGTYSSNFVAPVFLYLFAKVPGLDPTILKAVQDTSDRASVNYLMGDVIKQAEIEKKRQAKKQSAQAKKNTQVKKTKKAVTKKTVTKKTELKLEDAPTTEKKK